MSDRDALSPDRPNRFDLIRLSMAVLVVYAHAYPLSERGAMDPLVRWTDGRLGFGGVAVLVFFSISGYLVAASAERSRSPTDFLSRRVRRIYPGYVVAVAACAFAVSPCFSDASIDVPRRIAKFAIWAALLNAWTDTHAFAKNAMPQVVNGSLWTIQQEFFCYLLLAAITWLGGLRRSGGLLLVAGAMYAVHVARCLDVVHLRNFYLGVVYVQPVSLLLSANCFLVGAVAHAFRGRLRFRPSVAVACVLAIGVSARSSTTHDVVGIVLPIALPYVALTIAISRGRFATNFAARVGGDYSYGTYLYAFPIQQMLTAFNGGAMRPMSNFAIAAPLALLCGIASWHGIERRFVRRHRRERVATIVPELRAEARAD